MFYRFYDHEHDIWPNNPLLQLGQQQLDGGHCFGDNQIHASTKPVPAAGTVSQKSTHNPVFPGVDWPGCGFRPDNDHSTTTTASSVAMVI